MDIDFSQISEVARVGKEKERENIYVGKREKVENKDRLHMLISGDNRILTEDRYDT